MPNERLPIKIVIPRTEDYYVPKSGGGEKKVFGSVTPQIRQSLAEQITAVEQAFASSFQTAPDLPAVAKVVLKKEALAKSHRPEAILSDKTCPVIGIDQFGELLTSITAAGLTRLKRRILQDKTKVGMANISTIESIIPYEIISEAVNNLASKVEAGLNKVKLRLFKHQDPAIDTAVLRGFMDIINELQLPAPEILDYGKQLRVFRLTEMTPNAVLRLASFVGTQNISEFQSFRMVRHVVEEKEAVQGGLFGPPQIGIEYPVVGIIDSGTNPNDAVLSAWRTHRYLYVLNSEIDHKHGSFVAGLVAFPSQLHDGDTRFPAAQAKFVDIVALPKDDGASGGKITEDEAIEMIGESLRRFREPKIWNLSFGSDVPISDQRFSDFAIALDALQDEHDVTFVLASGNYRSKPLRKWPPTQDLKDADRICSPADSVRAITVGSAANLDGKGCLVKAGEPSPFSRRGPGPSYIPKPEVAHFGGNCSSTGNFAGTGVVSFDGDGNLVESIGTSFSAPLVANLLANIHHIAKDPMSRNLAKALLIHSAVLHSEHVEANELRYRGFGIPHDVEAILSCAPWAATLVFEGELWQIHDFEKRAFPIPQSFRTAEKKVKGEFIMTLVYDPPLNPNYGAEYCRSNMEVSLGTYEPDEEGEWHHSGKVPAEAGDFKQKFEHYMIEHGFKWSPVKVYRKSMRGIAGDEWRLHIDLQHRADFQQSAAQRFALVVSMFDKKKELPVYNDVVRAMQAQGWATTNLELRTDIRLSI